MLALRLTCALGPGRTPLPDHLGGDLHGFVEGAVLTHTPHLLPVLRPGGEHGTPHFALGVLSQERGDAENLTFEVLLYGSASSAWRQIVRALYKQTASRFLGRPIAMTACELETPDSPARLVLLDARLLESSEAIDDYLPLTASRFPTPMPDAPPRLYALEFVSPLLLASRKAQRRGAPDARALPWPPLGRVLESLAARIRTLEPELAEVIGLDANWHASDEALTLTPLTRAAAPARQVFVPYRSTPRNAVSQPGIDARRSFDIPGIVGELVYPANDEPLEFPLLYWGQWLRVGQKSTLGFGAYRLSVL
jgi:hypothetical protein